MEGGEEGEEKMVRTPRVDHWRQRRGEQDGASLLPWGTDLAK